MYVATFCKKKNVLQGELTSPLERHNAGDQAGIAKKSWDIKNEFTKDMRMGD